MFRVDAHHAYAPPQQGPDWYGKILARNKFQGSIYAPVDGSLDEALALAERYPYIRRVVPRLQADQLAHLPAHPLIVSVHLLNPTADSLRQVHERGLAAEINAADWPGAAPGRIALLGMPEDTALPDNVYVKLSGFRLPASPEQAQRLRQLLRFPGPERLMYASGWPHGGGTWKETLAAFTQCLGAMPIALREQLLGGTAADFYSL